MPKTNAQRQADYRHRGRLARALNDAVLAWALMPKRDASELPIEFERDGDRLVGRVTLCADLPDDFPDGERVLRDALKWQMVFMSTERLSLG